MLNRVLNLVRLSSALLATRPDMVCKSGYSSSDVVFTKELLALMPTIIW